MSELNQPDARWVLVLGGQGVLGKMLAEAFQTAGWSTIRAGRRPDDGADFRHVDLQEPETLEKMLGGADVVVSSVPDEQLVAERMVLDRGGLLINVSAMPASAVQRLRQEPGPSRGTVLMNAGIAPGLTSLLAADLLAEHPEADEVELVFTVSVKSSIGPAGGSFAHRGLTATGRHRTAVVPLPEPFGRRRCLGFAEADNGWLGDVADGKTVSPYLCIAERAVHSGLLTLNAAGLIGRVPRSAFATSSPGEASSEPIAHWIAARRRGTLLAARTVRCQGDYRAAAACTVIFARSLVGRAEPASPGVLVPEETFVIGELQPELGKAGISVADEQASTTARAA
jgi:NAD(P)-dependent dehydrogenase (short-subunit alcohol dehydrogenase family)